MKWIMLSIVMLSIGCFSFPRKFSTRGNGPDEVFVEGKWVPLVSTTSSKLERFVPEGLTPGEVVHINKDGTAILTNHVEASKRSFSEFQGKPGY